jgi:hypothetical protein
MDTQRMHTLHSAECTAEMSAVPLYQVPRTSSEEEQW